MKITVIGSSNTDMVLRVKSFPRAGETVLGNEFNVNHGGKGANQAVAAARLGGDIIFVCKIGNDTFGAEAKRNFRKENLDTSYLSVDDSVPSGVALILVDDKAENCIAVASGANGKFLPSDIDEEVFKKSEIVLLQLEIPLPTAEIVIDKGKKFGKKVILNPAPAHRLRPEILNGLYLITPNQTEAEILTGIKVKDEKSAELAAQAFIGMGVENVVITMGSKGAFLYDPENSVLVPSVKVTPVDTTAAGDVFNGALTVAIAEGKCLKDAVVFANAAAAVSVTKYGAQSSAPYRHEIKL